MLAVGRATLHAKCCYPISPMTMFSTDYKTVEDLNMKSKGKIHSEVPSDISKRIGQQSYLILCGKENRI